MGLVVYSVDWAEAYFHTKWHLDPSSRLVTLDMGQKEGAVVPLSGGGNGSSSNTMSPGPWLGPVKFCCFFLAHHGRHCANPDEIWH